MHLGVLQLSKVRNNKWSYTNENRFEIFMAKLVRNNK